MLEVPSRLMLKTSIREQGVISRLYTALESFRNVKYLHPVTDHVVSLWSLDGGCMGDEILKHSNVTPTELA